jgi:hypothetical protein
LRVCVFEKPTKTRREIKRIKKERKKKEDGEGTKEWKGIQEGT